MKRSLLLLCAILLVSSCASSRRLMRVFNEKTDKTVKEADRTNMFPLFYLSGTSSTFLWPLIDSDERGFSIRPFFNKEDNEYAALFPLSAWNPVENEGWVGPYYWNKDHAALFPIYYQDDKHTQFLTYYSYPYGSTLFPLYMKFDEPNGDSAFFTLLGGQSKQGDRTTSMAAMLWWASSSPTGSYKTLFPVFYHGKDELSETTYVFPWFSIKGENESGSMLFPFYLEYSDSNGDGGFYTLLGGRSIDGDTSKTMITPLWWSGSSPKSSYQTLLPVYHRSQYENGQSSYFFPYYSSSGKYHKSNWVFPLFKSVQRFNDEGELIRDMWNFPMILPLAAKRNTPNGSKTSALLGTLFEHEVSGESYSGNVLLFMADWEKDKQSSRFRFPAIYNFRGLVDVSKNEERSKVNLLLYSHEKTDTSVRRDIFPFITWDSGENESGFSFFWRVFERHNRNGKKGGHIFFIPYGA